MHPILPRKLEHDTERTQSFLEKVRLYNAEIYFQTGRQPAAFTHTYGCQQNVSDGEKLNGLLEQMGYCFVDSHDQADFVLFNTCAVREGAEDRVFGNVGALKHAKRRNPNMVVGLCGCMVQQKHVAQRIRTSFPFVDLMFGANAMDQLPELLYQRLTQGGRVIEIASPTSQMAEDLPSRRENGTRAWLPIMQGCNNFCSYCVVPYVRGRETSRAPEQVLEEARALIEEGYKEITLLGQNVNSYKGESSEQTVDFPSLLQMICDIPGEFTLRFMTSHPKDCSRELLDTMAKERKIAKHLHLPVQSGSNRILEQMNRGYTREHYLALIDYAREVCPQMTFTSDIIVGFPGETYEDFSQTVDLITQVGYHSLFTFLYSPREGTPAAKMADDVTLAQKKEWFQELLDKQEAITAQRHREMVGKTYRVLVEGVAKKGEGFFTGRSLSNVIVDFPATDELIGSYVDVRIVEAKNRAVIGVLTTQ